MGKKVLVVVDVQNDFIKGGVLSYGYPKQSNTDAIVDYVKKSVQEGGIVLATRDTHHDNYLETLEGKNLPVKHCIHQSKGWELVDGIRELNDSGKMLVFDKLTFGTPLVGEYIRHLMETEEIGGIELIGYDLSICVLANAVLLRSRFPNMEITVHKDLCGDTDEEAFRAALVVLQNQQIRIA